METIEIKDIEELNYGVCEYVLRMRLKDIVIHCSSSEILDSLGIYMLEIGIPWNMDHDASGVSMQNDYDLNRETNHICIIIDAKHPILSAINEKACAFLLRDINQEQINSLVTDPNTFDLDQVPIHLQNEEIRKMFLKAFIIADTEIDIISPWMNFSVVNKAFINLMNQALSRGVKIRILYGLTPNSDEYNQIRSTRSDLVADRLMKRFEHFGNLLKVTRNNIHYKLVLCDEKFKLEGGYNYLSFTGDYSDPNTRREGYPFGRDVNEIRYLRKLYFTNDSIEQ